MQKIITNIKIQYTMTIQTKMTMQDTMTMVMMQDMMTMMDTNTNQFSVFTTYSQWEMLRLIADIMKNQITELVYMHIQIKYSIQI